MFWNKKRKSKKEPKTEHQEEEIVSVHMNIFDEEEIYENCTVQILRNSVTGEVSIGWWPNEEGLAVFGDEVDE